MLEWMPATQDMTVQCRPIGRGGYQKSIKKVYQKSLSFLGNLEIFDRFLNLETVFCVCYLADKHMQSSIYQNNNKYTNGCIYT